MGLFRRKKKKPKQDIDGILSRISEDVLSEEDSRDQHKVQHYVLGHCEQIIETAKELEAEKAEYRKVTSYLTDIQIIEELPEQEAAELRDTAASILTLNQSRDDYLATSKRLSDTQFAQMQQQEDQISDAIRSLQANEAYQAAVKRDMNYLEGEKNEWTYYRQELLDEQKFLRKLSYVLFGLAVMALAVILALKVGLEMDVQLLLTICGFALAAAGGFILVKTQNNDREIQKAQINMNHAISLLNRTKIKYVHSTNAVDYACEKYHVHNSYELNYLWEQYQLALKEKEKFERNSEDLEYFNGRLVRLLQKRSLYDARVWINQPTALVDKREMVEIKHDLITRRQKIRSRIEYDMDVVLEQKEEIESLMKEYHEEIPEVREILNSIDRLTTAK